MYSTVDSGLTYSWQAYRHYHRRHPGDSIPFSTPFLRKDDDDWVKKCIEYEVEGPRPRGRPKRTWREVVREDCQARKLNKEDAMDRCKWRKMIKDVQ